MRLTDLPAGSAIFSGQVSLQRFTADLTRQDLAALQSEGLAALQSILTGAAELAVHIVPTGTTSEPDGIGWSLAHLIAHITATLEESAALASSLARGVEVTSRSRYEVPEHSLPSTAALLARLDESQRMCEGFLVTWPDPAIEGVTYTPAPPVGPLDAVACHALGLCHLVGHLAQVSETVAQSAEIVSTAS